MDKEPYLGIQVQIPTEIQVAMVQLSWIQYFTSRMTGYVFEWLWYDCGQVTLLQCSTVRSAVSGYPLKLGDCLGNPRMACSAELSQEKSFITSEPGPCYFFLSGAVELASITVIGQLDVLKYSYNDVSNDTQYISLLRIQRSNEVNLGITQTLLQRTICCEYLLEYLSR